jgi:hypothetical protein
MLQNFTPSIPYEFAYLNVSIYKRSLDTSESATTNMERRVPLIFFSVWSPNYIRSGISLTHHDRETTLWMDVVADKMFSKLILNTRNYPQSHLRLQLLFSVWGLINLLGHVRLIPTPNGLESRRNFNLNGI